MEGTEGQLCTRLTDCLSRYDTDYLAHLYGAVVCQITAVALGADTLLALAGEDGADLHFGDGGLLDLGGSSLVDLLIGTDDQLTRDRVDDVVDRAATEDALVERGDDILSLLDLTTDGKSYKVVIGRQAEMRIVDPNTHMSLISSNIPYGAHLFVEPGTAVKADDTIYESDPFNAVMVAEADGTLHFEGLKEGVTYEVQSESNVATGRSEWVIIESKDKNTTPAYSVIRKGEESATSYDLPAGALLTQRDGAKLKAGDIIAKIPRAVVKTGDITGGLPRVTELFEARNPTNPAVVSEIDGEVTLGRIRRGNREIIVTSKTGEERKYMVPLSRQILVQENDFVRAGDPISDGQISPQDILAILGPNAVQNYIVNGVQDVYRKQGVAINDKHFEIIVRQMLRKVLVEDAGDTNLLEQDIVDKQDIKDANDALWGKKVITDPGDSEEYSEGQIITLRRLRDANSQLRRKDLRTIEARDAMPAVSSQMLQGITKAALQTKSFMSAASFQETPKVLNNSAIEGKTDALDSIKENVIVGHLIPAGTGLAARKGFIVANKADLETKRLLEAAKATAPAPLDEAPLEDIMPED